MEMEINNSLVLNSVLSRVKNSIVYIQEDIFDMETNQKWLKVSKNAILLGQASDKYSIKTWWIPEINLKLIK